MPPLALVLSGGNALGAFQAGALAVLARRGIRPRWTAGTSIGAINAALFLAAKNEDAEHTLRRFWSGLALDLFALPGRHEELWASVVALLQGRPNLSRGRFGALVPLLSSGSSLQDPEPLRDSLNRLVDFDRLAVAGELWVGATALAPDTPHCFVSPRERIGPAHLLASCAFPVLFPPVRIDGRCYVDGGIALNLPIEPLTASIEEPFVCLAIDLFATGGPVPETLGEAAGRFQDLAFGLQSEHALARARAAAPHGNIIHVPYRPSEAEAAGKTLDFSRRSIERRWLAGEAAMTSALARLAGEPAPEN